MNGRGRSARGGRTASRFDNPHKTGEYPDLKSSKGPPPGFSPNHRNSDRSRGEYTWPTRLLSDFNFGGGGGGGGGAFSQDDRVGTKMHLRNELFREMNYHASYLYIF